MLLLSQRRSLHPFPPTHAAHSFAIHCCSPPLQGWGGFNHLSSAQLCSRPGLDLLAGGAKGIAGELKEVYVILFGVGQRDTEGIYSLRESKVEDGLPQETIMAFEAGEDAER